MDLTWVAAEQLREFQRLSQLPTSTEVTARLRGQELIVHKIADIVWPDWRSWEFPHYQEWWGRSYDLVVSFVSSCVVMRLAQDAHAPPSGAAAGPSPIG